MRKIRHPSQLRLLFILAVIIPCLVLGFIAVRSINREKAFIELRFQGTIDAELMHKVSVMNSGLDRILDELAASTPADAAASPQSAFSQWRSRSELIQVPFLLSPDLEIIWPPLSDSLSEREQAFLNWNRDFFTDRAAIPVYQNIALFYKDDITGRDEILTADKETAGEAFDADMPAAAKKKPAEPTAAPRLDSTAGKASDASKPATGKESKSKIEETQMEQQALSEFEKNAEVRERLYNQARAKGQQTSQRTVTPSPTLTEEEAPQQMQVDSIFISEPQRFSQITAGRQQGLIPRFIGDSLSLIFWTRETNGGFIGCLVDREVLDGRMATLLGNMYTPTRILTILDENGRPLLIPDKREQRDWRRPFVAREISERLPRWEVAAYLTDPGAFASRANLTTLMLWILVLFLFVAILSGGIYIMNRLQGEMQLARQKTTFVANVSHELKTPLTSIRMFAEMLKERRQPDIDKQEKYLNLMVSETERLTRLINNVLDFTRMERGEQKYEKKRLDIAFLCESLIENQRIRLEHNGFTLTFQNDLGEAFVEGDEESLMQALLNLFSNAEKYSETEKRIDVDITRTEGFVLINVKDLGSGIPASDAKRIFKEFYRVDESITSRVRGSGLGLPIALRIIRDHGGDIEYFPRDGGGSIFQVRLPLITKG
jgi:signal transduction histidine kinase